MRYFITIDYIKIVYDNNVICYLEKYNSLKYIYKNIIIIIISQINLFINQNYQIYIFIFL